MATRASLEKQADAIQQKIDKARQMLEGSKLHHRNLCKAFNDKRDKKKKETILELGETIKKKQIQLRKMLAKLQDLGTRPLPIEQADQFFEVCNEQGTIVTIRKRHFAHLRPTNNTVVKIALPNLLLLQDSNSKSRTPELFFFKKWRGFNTAFYYKRGLVEASGYAHYCFLDENSRRYFHRHNLEDFLNYWYNARPGEGLITADVLRRLAAKPGETVDETLKRTSRLFSRTRQIVFNDYPLEYTEIFSSPKIDKFLK